MKKSFPKTVRYGLLHFGQKPSISLVAVPSDTETGGRGSWQGAGSHVCVPPRLVLGCQRMDGRWISLLQTKV